MKHYTLILSLVSLFVAVPYQGICGDEPKPMTTIRLAVSQDGKGSLFVSNRPAVKSEQPKPPPSEPVELNDFGNATVSRLKDGRLKVNYDFSRVRNLNDLIPRGTPASGFKFPLSESDAKSYFKNLRIDPKEDVLVVARRPSESDESGFDLRIAGFLYPRLFRPPYEIEVKLIGDLKLGNNLHVVSEKYNLYISISPPKNEQTPNVSIHNSMGGGVSIVEGPMPGEYRFQINEKSTGGDTAAGILDNPYDRAPLVIRSFQVTAYFPAVFGLELGQSRKEENSRKSRKRGDRVSQVIVEKVQKESAAEKAGIKKGDILLRVGTQAASDTKTTRKLLSECKIGTPVDLEVLRLGKKTTIAVTPR